MTGSQREAIEIMKMMESVTVNADLIAQALGMNPGVLRKHVKDGDYHISAYEVSGDRVRFFRKDFLQKCGFMEPEKEEPTVEQQLLETLKDIREMLICMMTAGQALVYAMRRDEKAAGAGTPTD